MIHTFLVVFVTARFHHSTDGFIGWHKQVVESFHTLNEAYEYITLRNYITLDGIDEDPEQYYMIEQNKVYDDLTMDRHQFHYWSPFAPITAPSDWNTVPF